MTGPKLTPPISLQDCLRLIERDSLRLTAATESLRSELTGFLQLAEALRQRQADIIG